MKKHCSNILFIGAFVTALTYAIYYIAPQYVSGIKFESFVPFKSLILAEILATFLLAFASASLTRTQINSVLKRYNIDESYVLTDYKTSVGFGKMKIGHSFVFMLGFFITVIPRQEITNKVKSTYRHRKIRGTSTRYSYVEGRYTIEVNNRKKFSVVVNGKDALNKISQVFTEMPTVRLGRRVGEEEEADD